MSGNLPSQVNTLVRVPAITISTGITLGVAVLIATAGYIFVPDPYKNALLFLAAACAAAGQLAAALYAARVLQLSANIQSATDSKAAAQEGALIAKDAALIRHRMIATAVRYAERWNDPSMFFCRKLALAIVAKKGRPDDIKAIILEKDDNQANVKQLLNFLEELSLAVQMEHYCDESTARDLFCGVVVTTWQCMEPWVDEQRASSGRGKIWVQLEALYHRWK